MSHESQTASKVTIYVAPNDKHDQYNIVLESTHGIRWAPGGIAHHGLSLEEAKTRADELRAPLNGRVVVLDNPLSTYHIALPDYLTQKYLAQRAAVRELLPLLTDEQFDQIVIDGGLIQNDIGIRTVQNWQLKT